MKLLPPSGATFDNTIRVHPNESYSRSDKLIKLRRMTVELLFNEVIINM